MTAAAPTIADAWPGRSSPVDSPIAATADGTPSCAGERPYAIGRRRRAAADVPARPRPRAVPAGACRLASVRGAGRAARQHDEEQWHEETLAQTDQLLRDPPGRSECGDHHARCEPGDEHGGVEPFRDPCEGEQGEERLEVEGEPVLLRSIAQSFRRIGAARSRPRRSRRAAITSRLPSNATPPDARTRGMASTVTMSIAETQSNSTRQSPSRWFSTIGRTTAPSCRERTAMIAGRCRLTIVATRGEHSCEHDRGDRRNHARRAAARDALADRDVRAGDEHQQREADVGEKDERRLGRVERARACVPDGDPGRDLPDDDGRRSGRKQRAAGRASRPRRSTRASEAQNTPASRPAAMVSPAGAVESASPNSPVTSTGAAPGATSGR